MEQQIVIYEPTPDFKMQVKTDGETVWLSIDQMAELFGRDKSVIGKHVRNVFKEGELEKNSVWAKFAYTADDGKTYQVDGYNLDVIISVGYRVKSVQGTRFGSSQNLVEEIALSERIQLRRPAKNAPLPLCFASHLTATSTWSQQYEFLSCSRGSNPKHSSAEESQSRQDRAKQSRSGSAGPFSAIGVNRTERRRPSLKTCKSRRGFSANFAEKWEGSSRDDFRKMIGFSVE